MIQCDDGFTVVGGKKGKNISINGKQAAKQVTAKQRIDNVKVVAKAIAVAKTEASAKAKNTNKNHDNVVVQPRVIKPDTNPFSYANMLKKNPEKEFTDTRTETIINAAPMSAKKSAAKNSQIDEKKIAIKKEITIANCSYGMDCKHGVSCKRWHHNGEKLHFNQLQYLNSIEYRCKYKRRCRDLPYCDGHTDLEHYLVQSFDEFEFSPLIESCYQAYMCPYGLKCSKDHLPGERWHFMQEKMAQDNDQQRCANGIRCKKSKCKWYHTDLELFLALSN